MAQDDLTKQRRMIAMAYVLMFLALFSVITGLVLII